MSTDSIFFFTDIFFFFGHPGSEISLYLDV